MFVKIGDSFLNLEFVQKVTTNPDGSLHAAHGSGATEVPVANVEKFVEALKATDTAPPEKHEKHGHEAHHKKADK